MKKGKKNSNVSLKKFQTDYSNSANRPGDDDDDDDDDDGDDGDDKNDNEKFLWPGLHGFSISKG